MLSTQLSSPIPDIIEWDSADTAIQNQYLSRPVQHTKPALRGQIERICDNIRQFGDNALLDYTEQFDGIRPSCIELSPAQIKAQADKLPTALSKAIDQAYASIRLFHEAQMPQTIKLETVPGVNCEQRFAPLTSIGLYVPGGNASLPSTVLMGGIPAQIAKCPSRVLISPPAADGLLSPAICYAALKCSFTNVYLGGGAQAIAALAYGTDTITAVDKIFGPGNRYVTAAKQYVSQLPNGPSVDLPAGPSELMIIADNSADAEFVAADLLSQAEHGPDSQVILASPCKRLLNDVRVNLAEQLSALPRASIATEALKASRLILTRDIRQATAISRRYAPEHLSLQLAQAQQWVEACTAGSLFIGHYSPESAGDYATGTNHILPTYGYARTHNSLGLLDFYRRYTVQTLTAYGLQTLAPVITTLADEEKLDAHRLAVSRRLNSQRMRDDLNKYSGENR